jgi:hypothetical protein
MGEIVYLEMLAQQRSFQGTYGSRESQISRRRLADIGCFRQTLVISLLTAIEISGRRSLSPGCGAKSSVLYMKMIAAMLLLGKRCRL